MSTAGVPPETRSAIIRPAPGPMPKPWPENRCRGKSPAAAALPDHRHGVRHHIDQARPAGSHLHACKGRERGDQVALAHGQNGLIRPGIKDAHALERRDLIHPPAFGGLPIIDELPAKAHAQFMALFHQSGQEIEEQAETVRDDRGHGRTAMGDGVAAIGALAESEIRSTNRMNRWALERFGPHDRACTLSCGKSMPRLPRNSRDHTPVHKTARWQAMTPRSVITPLTRPPEVSRPRTAHCSRTLPPKARTRRAMAGTAFEGSARQSFGVNKARHSGGPNRAAPFRFRCREQP